MPFLAAMLSTMTISYTVPKSATVCDICRTVYIIRVGMDSKGCGSDMNIVFGNVTAVGRGAVQGIHDQMIPPYYISCDSAL